MRVLRIPCGVIMFEIFANQEGKGSPMRAFRTITTIVISLSVAGALTGCVSPAESVLAEQVEATGTPGTGVVATSSTTMMGTATAGSTTTSTVEVTSDDGDAEVIPNNNAPTNPSNNQPVGPVPQDTTDDTDTDTGTDDEPQSTEVPDDFFGDVDGDGQLTNEDLMSLLATYGIASDGNGDLNDDGIIDLTDIAILLSLID